MAPRAYKVVCISLYAEDLEQLEAKVRELRQRGLGAANKSRLIRIALSRMDVEVAASIIRTEPKA